MSAPVPPEGVLVFGEDGREQGASVPKTATGIPGFDQVAMGGLPSGRATVLAGQAGSAKSVFAGQFLAEGVRRGQPAVYVTLEEPAADLRANLATLGFDVAAWEAAGDWRFVDASPLSTDDAVAPYDLETLAAQIGHAVDATGATRLVLDSLNAVLSLQPDPVAARQTLRRLITRLRALGLTVVLTVETPGDPGGTLSRYGIEEFVADGVVLLRNVREGSFRRRTVEVLKMRGAMHHKGDVPFTVIPGRGLVVLPVGERVKQPTDFSERVSSGIEGLDAMLHGGLFRGASTLVNGPTGSGKTMIATQFVGDALARGESVLLLAYEETLDQVYRNGATSGHDFETATASGLLHVVSVCPEVASLDDHLVEVRRLVEKHRPSCLVLDSLSALERLGSEASFRQFVIGLTSFVKQIGLASLFTASSASPSGATSVTANHISGLVDAMVLLRHVQVGSRLRRGLLVVKMRGSGHEQDVRELLITDGTLRIGDPLDAGTQDLPAV